MGPDKTKITFAIILGSLVSACAHTNYGMVSDQIIGLETGLLPCQQTVIADTCLGSDWENFRQQFASAPDDTISLIPSEIEQEQQALTRYLIQRPAADLNIDVTIQHEQIVNLFISQSYWDKTSTQQLSRKPVLSLIEDMKQRHPEKDWSILSPEILIEEDEYIVSISLQRNSINYSLKR